MNKIPDALNAQVLEFMKSKGQDMVQHFQKMQQDLEKKEIIGVAGVVDSDEIFVKVVFNGLQECKKCTIGKGAYDEGISVVTDLVVAAINNAMEKLKGVMQTEVMDVYKKSNLPLGEPEEGEGKE